MKMNEMNLKEMETVNGGKTDLKYVIRDFPDWFDEKKTEVKKGVENVGNGLGFLFKTIWDRIF